MYCPKDGSKLEVLCDELAVCRTCGEYWTEEELNADRYINSATESTQTAEVTASKELQEPSHKLKVVTTESCDYNEHNSAEEGLNGTR